MLQDEMMEISKLNTGLWQVTPWGIVPADGHGQGPSCDVSWVFYWFYPSVIISCFKGLDCTDEPVEYPDNRRLRADLAVRFVSHQLESMGKIDAELVN